MAESPVGRAPLETYRSMRDFSLTPEPRGEAEPEGRGSRLFVVQRHRARRLHYDVRLEVDGVLASWAVPKGPTLDPSVRSLAVHVEDHPLEYRDFEGVIPGGQYGSGDVIVWDRGTWEPARLSDPAGAIAAGELHFDLFGEKLRGRFALVRTRRDRGGKEQWLLLHKHDDAAVDGWDPEDHPRSVKSGRTNDEVAAAPAAMWRSDLPPADAEIAVDGEAGSAGRASRPPRLGRSGSGSGRDGGEHEDARPEAAPVWDPPTEAELAALDGLGREGSWELQGRRLRLTNLDKVLVPGRDGGAPLTKRDLVRYHATIAPVMLPYLEGRPVNLHRFPNGTDRPGFWHKQVPTHAPAWLTRWHNEDAGPGESESYFVVDSPPALAWMANYAAVELHAWTSRIPDVRQPTWALIDIDPGPGTTFADVVLLARLFRSGLEHLGVTGLPKVTGQRGLHVYVPLVGGYSFEDTRTWVETLSRAVGATVPELVSWSWQKTDRNGLARLDYTQNARNKTLVAPYSVRPAPGAPVSVPIRWEELDDPDLRGDRWTVRDIPGRLAVAGDPFRDLLGAAQRLPPI